ncbi:chaplin family protein [Streptomyces sp. NPDC102473]|uniref:chaplin family protein n=1 Tax=Streptomyces sp. NPDC102473 TaxID=3366180 RepID=UPI00380A0607
MKNLKKAAAVTMIAGGLVATGAGAASATAHGHGGAAAHGQAVGSPGVASGNLVQVPVHVPVNVVGNTVNVIGLLNPAFGNLGLNS